jgi:hypothetical protein
MSMACLMPCSHAAQHCSHWSNPAAHATLLPLLLCSSSPAIVLLLCVPMPRRHIHGTGKCAVAALRCLCRSLPLTSCLLLISCCGWAALQQCSTCLSASPMQAAYVLATPDGWVNPFWNSVPSSLFWPMMAVATAASSESGVDPFTPSHVPPLSLSLQTHRAVAHLDL